jgi:RNA polymerase sigma-70 factor, ECF subfamily
LPENPEKRALGDREVAARLVAGDEAALREAYRVHAPAVLGLALRVLSNTALAEDVVQDVFVRLWERPERFDADRGPLRAFLLSMAHSRAVERVRSEESLRNRHAKLERQPLRVADDPARVVETREADDAVRAALAALPEIQRRPIEMAYYEGLSYREVAQSLGEPEGTVKYRIRMGMQQLRAALRAREDAP